MTILFGATVKTSQPRDFGRGILPTCPVHYLPVSVADMEWAAANLNDDEPAIDWDAEFELAAAVELIEAGYCPF